MKGKISPEKAVLLLTASGILLFWIAFFINLKHGNLQSFASKEPCWLKWELSFPLADMLTAVLLIFAFAAHTKNSAVAYVYQAVASGGMLFLGLIDITFFVENGLYRGLDGLFEALTHLWLLIAGLYLAVRSMNMINRRIRHEDSHRV